MMLSNKVYDVLKFVAQVGLPSLAVAYAGLAKIWGFPFAEEIPASIMVIVMFLGALLQLSTAQYNKAN